MATAEELADAAIEAAGVNSDVDECAAAGTDRNNTEAGKSEKKKRKKKNR